MQWVERLSNSKNYSFTRPRQTIRRMLALILMTCMVFSILGINTAAASGSASIYYVHQAHPAANDSNPGTDENHPWKTLEKALSTVQPGDTVIVGAGTYTDTNSNWEHAFNPAHSGTEEAPITFKGEPARVPVIVGGSSQTAWGIYNRSHIVIDGFTIKDGQLKVKESDGVIFKNNEVIGGGYEGGTDKSLNWGICALSAQECVISNNFVHDMRSSGNNEHNTACIMVFGSQNIIVENNTADAGNGIVFSAFGQKGGNIDDCIWRNNIARNATTAFLGMGSTDESGFCHRCIYHNNLAVNCNSFLLLDHNCIGFKVYNNSAVGGSYFIYGGYSADTELNSDIQAWNNVYFGPQALWRQGGSTATNWDYLIDYSDYNAITNYACAWNEGVKGKTLTQWQNDTSFDDHSLTITESPFTDSANYNFTLKPGAPAQLKQGIDRQDYDNDGNITENIPMGAVISGTEVFGYRENSDMTAPTTPTNLAANSSSASQISLTWSASNDNIGVTGYQIYRNNTQIGTSTTTSYSDTTVAASTTYSYTVAAYDAAGNLSSKSTAVSVTTPAAPVNHAPVLAFIGAKSVNEAANLSFTVSATDADAGTTLTYSATGLPTEASFNAATRTFSWTPTLTQSGTYTIRFTVSDGALTDYEDVVITVNNVNQAPVLASIGNKTGKTGTPISFTISATDPDAGTTLSYTITNPPAGADFNTATRTFTWTPAPNQVGVYTNIRFQVSDGSLTDAETISITVSDGTPPTAPTGLTASTQSASQINLSWSAATDNVGVAGYRIYRNASSVGTTTNLNYTDSGLLPGTSYTYTVVAYDGLGNTSSMSNSSTAVTSSGISLSSTNEYFSANAGKGRIDVYASTGLAWTVGNIPSWIHVTTGANGTGNGLVEYTVDQNIGARRSGNFTVNAIPVTVTQQTHKNASGIGLYNPANQQFILWNSTTGSPTTQDFSPTGSGWIPLSGDWDGNKTVTLGLYEPQTQTFHLRDAQSGSANLNFSYGTAGVAYIPVSGDWDGDGSDSVGLYNPAAGTFRLTNTNGTGASDNYVVGFEWFESTWIPIAGDWDGDGVDTVGLYSPKDGAFFLKNSHTGEWADIVFVYGPAGSQWLPIVGDWDGDQATGVGLYDPANKTFLLRDSVTSGAADISFSYNAAGTNWIPLSGDWDGQ